MRLQLLALILAALVSMSFSADVSSCINITSPGVYDVTANLFGLPNMDGGNPWDSAWCIQINASNVALDCHGFYINKTAPPPNYQQEHGIRIVNAPSNVTVRNCRVGNYSLGILLMNATNARIANNSIIPYYGGGVVLDQNTYNITLANNTVNDAAFLHSMSYNIRGTGHRLINNTGIGATSFCMDTTGNYSLYANNTCYNNSFGIMVESGSIGNNFTGNNVSKTINAAFYVGVGGDSNNFDGNYVSDWMGEYDCFVVGGDYNNVSGNVLEYGNSGGRSVLSVVPESGFNLFFNNTVRDVNGGMAFDPSYSANNSFIGNHISNIDSGIHFHSYGGDLSAANITVANNTFEDVQGAIVFNGGRNIDILNNTFRNTSSGIEISGGILGHVAIVGNTFNESALFDILVRSENQSVCTHFNISGNTGSGGRPILYYNDTVYLSNVQASEIILCNADDSVLDGVSVRGSDTLLDNMLESLFSDNVTIKNSNSSDNMVGFLFYYTENSTFINNTALISAPITEIGEYVGFYMLSMSGTLFERNTASGELAGFYVAYGSGNTFRDNAASGNSMGYVMQFLENTSFSGDRALNSSDSLGLGFPSGTGFVVMASANNNFSGILASGNSQMGFLEFSPSGQGSIISDSTFHSNSWGVGVISTSEAPVPFEIRNSKFGSSSINVSLSDMVTYGFLINDTGDPSGNVPPSNLSSFRNKYLKINFDNSMAPPEPSIDLLAFHWRASEESGYNMSSLGAYTWNGSAWAIPEQASDLGSRSITLASVMNITADDIYGLFAISAASSQDDDDEPPPEEVQPPPLPPPECTADGQCAVNERCVDGKCTRFECLCGQAKDHACVQFECCLDAQCGSGERCENNACIAERLPQEQCLPPKCCQSDAQCGPVQICEKATGAVNGSCRDIVACGRIENHAVVEAWECGSGPCPACPQGSLCAGHKCFANDMSCPTSGLIGDETTCEAKEENGPCAACDYEITDPTGKKFSGRTDENGNFAVPLAVEGTYVVSLLKNGAPIKTIELKSMPRSPPAEPEKPAAQVADNTALIGVLALAVIGILAFLYLRRGKRKG